MLAVDHSKIFKKLDLGNMGKFEAFADFMPT